jgi:hypothetical protein
MEMLGLSPARRTEFIMPKVSRLSLAPLSPSDETCGEWPACAGGELGFAQRELTGKTGLIQTLVSDDERGKLRLNADMLHRLATESEVSSRRGRDDVPADKRYFPGNRRGEVSAPLSG